MNAYLDHAAGSPMRPAATAAYLEAAARAGNPSSTHRHGQVARDLLEDARERLAAALDCEPVEVVLTSGGTESVSLAVAGAVRASGRSVVLLPGGEHAATVATLDALVAAGEARAVPLRVDGDCRLDPGVLDDALGAEPDAALVTAVWANNEVGTVNPAARLGAVSRAHGVPLHLDAVGAFGQVPVSFAGSGASLLSVGSLKVGGPPGVGALVVDRRTPLVPLVHGGGQERGLRAGTPSVPGAVAFAVAAEEAVRDLDAEARRLAALRDRALAGVLAGLPGARLRGAAPGPARLPGNLHVTVPGTDGEALLLQLDAAGVSVSTGAACAAGVTRVSAVLMAMGVPAADARGALRITFGHSSSEADVDALLAALPSLVRA